MNWIKNWTQILKNLFKIQQKEDIYCAEVLHYVPTKSSNSSVHKPYIFDNAELLESLFSPLLIHSESVDTWVFFVLVW
jgi:hypothetical protein